MIDDIRGYAQWVNWKTSGGRKFFTTTQGDPAKSNDPETWTDYETACGNGKPCFVLSEGDPFFGIDLDDCFDEGRLNEFARRIINPFMNRALIEISQSGKGIHITAIGKKPIGRSNWTIEGQRVEVYDHARFWIVTFKPLFPGDDQGLMDCQDQLDEVLEWMERTQDRAKALKPTAKPIGVKFGGSEIEERARAYLAKIPCDSEGGRNNQVFKTAGHLLSLRGGHGERLSIDQVKSLIFEWWGPGQAGFDRKEIETAIESASRNGQAREEKYPDRSYKPATSEEVLASVQIDLSGEIDQEEQVESMIPASGLMREVYDYYFKIAISPSPILGLAAAVAVMETVLGHKVQSHTGLRTNDLNVILGPTGCGKEACEKTISKIFEACDLPSMVMPAGVQSGNGLLGYMAENPVCCWVKDEFGVYLENVFGKRKQPMEAQVGRLLLELYNKADGRYSGNAHASGVRNAIEQPHLVLLGLSTQGTIFDSLSFKDVENGLMNRLAFWIVTERPELKDRLETASVPESIVEKVKAWQSKPLFEVAGSKPDPFILQMDSEALARWDAHRRAIHNRSMVEDDGRSSMWSRTAARSMKFAMLSRCSRESAGIFNSFNGGEGHSTAIQITDVDWAIRLSNYLTRQSCTLIETNTINPGKSRAEIAIMDFVLKAGDWVSLRAIQHKRHISKGDLVSAATRLAAEGKIAMESKPYGKKEQVKVRKADPS